MTGTSKAAVCAAGSCEFCGCTFRKPSDAMRHRCAAMQEAIDHIRAVRPPEPSRPITGGLLHHKTCPHCGREIESP